MKTAALEGGTLHFTTDDSSGREVVLALPLSKLLVSVLRVPAEEDPVAFATPLMKARSPYPDEAIAVSCELVSETPEGKVVIAAALPEGSSDDIAEQLDAAKLSVVRIDSLELGALRGIWSELSVDDGRRRLVVLKSADCRALIVLDGDQPVAINTAHDEVELERVKTLTLLEAEDFAGPRELAETVVREVDVEAALVGVRERTEAEGSLNALPESWGEVLAEERFKAKLIRNLSIAGGIWLLVMSVLFGVPIIYGLMTSHVTGLCKQHARQYKLVSDKKAKTELVQKYSDHIRGALEILKAVSDRLPAGVTLSGWDFTRGDGIRVRGEADDKGAIYEFKDKMVAMTGEPDDDGDAETIFKSVRLGAVSSQKDGRQKFELECHHEADDEEGSR